MDSLTIFGFLAVSSMLLCDTFERRSYWMTLLFGGACLLGSTYGFLQGAWPFGVLEGIWACIKVCQFYVRRKEFIQLRDMGADTFD